MENKTHGLYEWQKDAYGKISGKNAVLSAPTGSGKTWVAYMWAGIGDQDMDIQEIPKGVKIIFTSPIKALSNERYMDLLSMGLDVGIETGDFKKNSNAPIICCTQEIYGLKYAGMEGIKLIIDEFHYIFTESERSRAYIDAIRKTSQSVPILVMSATFGGAERVRAYLERIASRPFVLYESKERATELIFCKNPADVRKIRDSLVFVFSSKGARQLADIIGKSRYPFDESRKRRLMDLAWILEVEDIRPCMFKGVGVYHGSLLPKEKLLVERAYRERIIDVVVGTDALALGVNLPAKTAVFGQLVKFHDRMAISKNAFLQMAGRAGRKGLFEKGYVTYLEDSPAEAFGVKTRQVFEGLLSSPTEEAKVELRPNFGSLLKSMTTPEEEAETVSSLSLPELDYKEVLWEIKDSVKEITASISRMVPDDADTFKKILADVWYGEMEIEQNLDMAGLFYWGTGDKDYVRPRGIKAAEILLKYERNELQALLKAKRFDNALPEDYKLASMDEVDHAIEDIDPTVFGFEEKIKEMDLTKVDLPEGSVRLNQRHRNKKRQAPVRRRKSR